MCLICNMPLTMRASIFMNSGINRTALAPVGFQALMDSGNGQPGRLCPLGQALGNPLNCDHAVIAFIALLFKSASPSHIARLVMSIDINAVKRMFQGWATPQYAKKMLVRIKAKLNTSTAVLTKISISRIHASAFGSAIRVIFWAVIGACCRFAMGTQPSRLQLFLQATTGFGSSTSQVGSLNSNYFAALAPAYPKVHVGIWGLAAKSKNGQPPECLSG